MSLFLVALTIISGGGTIALLCRKKPQISQLAGGISLTAGALIALVGIGLDIKETWSIYFQLPVVLLALAAAVYSPGYLSGHGKDRSGIYWFFLNLTVASMLAVTLAETPLAFLLAWEMMGLASGVLVMFDRTSENARRAGWLYFAACHAGAAFLMLLFLFPGNGALSLLLAMIGFGLKIGFPLLHIWLPEAHPEAPAPVSALMSGAMIELGYYGLFFFAGKLEFPIAPMGWSLLILGMIGALGGILFALPQNNLKRLLAYSSVENMGLIGIAFGLGLLGIYYNIEWMEKAGMWGAALHILNHALLKGGLFLGAGAVLKSTGTLDIDNLGGLMRKTPLSGTIFTLNAAGLCGLPPFNGFVSEFLIYVAAFHGVLSNIGILQLFSFAALLTVALTGGMATAALVKAIGAVFLGEPRTKQSADAREVSKGMLCSLVGLFVLSLCMVFATPFMINMDSGEYCEALANMTMHVAIFCGCISIFLAVVLFLQHIWGRKKIRRSCTWDCGYARPDARMEYTGTAFTQPLTDLFAPILKVRKQLIKPESIFPTQASLDEQIEDRGVREFWKPLTVLALRFADRIHTLQSGSLHFYILLMLLTLGAMLLYALIREL